MMIDLPSRLTLNLTPLVSERGRHYFFCLGGQITIVKFDQISLPAQVHFEFEAVKGRRRNCFCYGGSVIFPYDWPDLVFVKVTLDIPYRNDGEKRKPTPCGFVWVPTKRGKFAAINQENIMSSWGRICFGSTVSRLKKVSVAELFFSTSFEDQIGDPLRQHVRQFDLAEFILQGFQR